VGLGVGGGLAVPVGFGFRFWNDISPQPKLKRARESVVLLLLSQSPSAF
jgi:hypothetical protein